ncbi:MAG: hypothetical protein N2489_08190 [Clostridia bacterium]|nr:hypothetical protein [Clostridia bacterium]
MSKDVLHLPQMLLIGSTGRNSGKTTLASAFISKWKKSFSVIGLKVTTVKEREGKCPRGGEGCGVCGSLNASYEIIEETNLDTGKDTSLLLKAGAHKVFWLKTLESHIFEGIKDFMSRIPEGSLIVCESNSLRKVVNPGCFIMLSNTRDGAVKDSAGEVMHKADIVIEDDFINDIGLIITRVEVDLGKVKINQGV